MNRKKPRRNCRQCGAEVREVAAIYCSNACQRQYQYETYIAEWQAGKQSGRRGANLISLNIRRYLLERDGEKCGICGWDHRHSITNRVPLEVDHIDGDNTNNKEENLRLLCPNCHSLTPTFRNLNRGKGREARRKKQAISLPT